MQESVIEGKAPSEFQPIPYEQFIAERHKIIDARARSYQRTDQLVTGGAAGALVLSITFLEKIAPNPSERARWVLVAAWALLLASLGFSLASHYASRSAFNKYLREFDDAYKEGRRCDDKNRATQVVEWLDRLGAILFVVGIAVLAVFAFLSLPTHSS
jgi:hypothetical protein